MIFTSNYARQGNNPLAIAISVGPPDWFKGEHFDALAPTWDMVTKFRKGQLNMAQYSMEYCTLLKERKIDAEKLLELPDGTMLLCYESPGQFCHRRLLADWVYQKTGVVIPEWKNEKERKEDEWKVFVDSVLDF